jgi:hypothetical protein
MKLKSAEHFLGAGRFDRRQRERLEKSTRRGVNLFRTTTAEGAPPVTCLRALVGPTQNTTHIQNSPYISSMQLLLRHERRLPFTLLAAATLRHALVHRLFLLLRI